MERGLRQASRMPMYSNSSLGSRLDHVWLSNSVTSVSFCVSWGGAGVSRGCCWWPTGPAVCPQPRCGYLSGHELSEAGREGQRGDEQCHQRGEQQAPGGVAQEGVTPVQPQPCHPGGDGHSELVVGTRRHLLLHQEAVDGLLAAHELHDLAVEVDEERAPEAAGDPGGEPGVSARVPLPPRGHGDRDVGTGTWDGAATLTR